MKKIGTIIVIFLLALGWHAPGVLAQGPDEGVKDELFGQLPNPQIELVSQIGGSINHSWIAQDVAISGTTAYVATTIGLHLIDVSDLANPREISFYDAPNIPGAGEVIVRENIAYLANGNLHIIDVSNPLAPSQVGLYNSSTVWDIAVAKNTVYIAGLWDGVKFVDVSNLATPRLIGSYPTPDRAGAVAVEDYLTYITDVQGVVHVIDTSNLAFPGEIGSYHVQGWPNDVAIVGDKLYVTEGLAIGFGSLYIIDVSRPTSPTEIGYISLGGGQEVMVKDNYAYVAAEDSGFRLVSIANPRQPIEIGAYDTPGMANGVAVASNTVYLADGDGGLAILRLLRHKITGDISTSGGYLVSPAGDTSLYFPSGAFSDNVAVTYRHVWQDQDVGDLVGIGYTFEIEAVSHVTGRPAQLSPGQTFEIQAQYTDAERGPAIENTLALYYWAGNQWVKETSSVVNPANHTVSAKPNHWTTLWAVLGQTRRMFMPSLWKK
ncbi:MAG: hypothetical protein U0401_03655 [Anaerolineae bacterium]